MVEARIATEVKGPVGFVRIAGGVDAKSAEALHESIGGLLGQKCSHIVVTLADTTFMASAAWGVLMRSMRELRGRGGSVLVAGMPEPVQHTFDLLGLHTFLKSFPSEDAAARTLQA